MDQLYNFISLDVEHYIHHGHLMIILGDDFAYTNAIYNFYNYDLLIHYFNNKYKD